MSKSREFVKAAIEELDYYVYIYSDPDTRIPFYIGKGKGNRCFAHLFQEGESEKIKKIQELTSQGKQPIIEVLIRGVDEETAFKVEAACIDLIGIENLTNIQKGHHSKLVGRVDVDDLNQSYNRKVLLEEDITDNVMMIRINQLYHYGMTEVELYDATRSCWRVNLQQANKVSYVLAVYDGIVQEVYKVSAWVPCYSTLMMREIPQEIIEKDKALNKYEFVGTIAEESVRQKYLGGIVSGLFTKGAQSPFKYFWHE